MKVQNGISRQINEHPDRDKILARLLQGESTGKLSREYGIHHSLFARTRKRLQQKIEPLVSASLSELSPEFAARTPQAQHFTLWGVLEDLNENRRELNELKGRPDIKISQLIQIAGVQSRIAETLIKLADTAARHGSAKNNPDYQKLQKAIADTVRAHPEIRQTFKDAMERQSLPGEEEELNVI